MKTLMTAAVLAMLVPLAGSAGEFGPKPGGIWHYPSYPPTPYPNPGPFPPRPYPNPGPLPPAPVDFDYVVFFRPSPYSGWEVYGKFETPHGARAAEERLEYRGIPAKVERVRDRGYPRW